MFTLGLKKESKEILKGGKGDNMPDESFDKKSLKKGMKHESEHTKNKAIEKEIAKDHLAEDPKYYKKLEKVEKVAFAAGLNKIAFGVSPIMAGSLGGLTAGYSGGRSAAETTAGHLSAHGHKTRNEKTSKTLAMLTAPAGAVVGLALASKHKHKIMPALRKHLGNSHEMEQVYEAALPAVSGIGGGLAAGVGTGALMALRGRFSKKKHPTKEKTASELSMKAPKHETKEQKKKREADEIASLGA